MSTEHIYELLKDVNDQYQYVKRGELVRCRECKRYDASYHWCNHLGRSVEENAYCSYAERNTNAQPINQS